MSASWQNSWAVSECEAIFVKIWECKANLWKWFENVKQYLWKSENVKQIYENNLRIWNNIFEHLRILFMKTFWECETKSMNIWECKINFWKQLASVNKIYKHFRNSNKINENNWRIWNKVYEHKIFFWKLWYEENTKLNLWKVLFPI